MKKITVLCIVALLVMNGIFTTSAMAESKFKDIGDSHWAKKEIEFLSNQGVISGDGGGRFHPNSNITREQAALMLGRLFQLKNQGASYAITDLIDFDILGKEARDQRTGSMTRGEMAKAISFAYDLESKKEFNFTDVPKSNKYYKFINIIAQNKITQGYPDGTFKPNEPVTRAQFCVFLSKAINLGITPTLKDRLRIGLTRAEVLHILGEPHQKFDLMEAEDQRSWIYINNNDKSKLPKVLRNYSVPFLQLVFKANGKVMEIHFLIKDSGTFNESTNTISDYINSPPEFVTPWDDKYYAEWRLDSDIRYRLSGKPELKEVIIKYIDWDTGYEIIKGHKIYGFPDGWETYWQENGVLTLNMTAAGKSL